jgi:hypothetical protein
MVRYTVIVVGAGSGPAFAFISDIDPRRVSLTGITICFFVTTTDRIPDIRTNFGFEGAIANSVAVARFFGAEMVRHTVIVVGAGSGPAFAFISDIDPRRVGLTGITICFFVTTADRIPVKGTILRFGRTFADAVAVTRIFFAEIIRHAVIIIGAGIISFSKIF